MGPKQRRNDMRSNELYTAMWPRFAIGYDRLLDHLVDFPSPASGGDGGGYPPYVIVKSGEDMYCIEMALAGFTKAEIKVEVKENNLTIEGDLSGRHDNSDYVHKGIARRAFQRKFILNDTIEVEGAELTDGVLHISLKQNIPEEQRPKLITIN